MYDIDAIKRKIGKDGLITTLEILDSPDLPEYIKNDLAKCNIFVNNHLNVHYLSSLAS